MSDDVPSAADFGHLLGLLVHDLRNPAATVGANVDFLREVEIADPDAREALDDVALALDELKRGLTQVGWLARTLGGERAMAASASDARPSLERVTAKRGVALRVGGGTLEAAGGASAGDLVQVLLDNADRHARGTEILVEADARPEGGILVRVSDGGVPVAPALREAAFSIAGQHDVKGKAEGRYGRFAGLVAARAAAESLGGTLRADERDGRCVFELVLPGV
ncbi:MAG: ATP-binding protein [Myxococcota bacterium]